MPPSALRFRLASPDRLRSLSAGPILTTDELRVPGPPGHIDLAAPVAHPWFRSAIAAVLGLTHSQLARIVEHDQALPLSSGVRGAAAVREALRSTDLCALSDELRQQLHSRPDDGRLRARSRICDTLLNSGNRPEWLVLEVLLVPRPCPQELERLYSAVLGSDSTGVSKAVAALFGHLRGSERRPSLTSHLGRRPGLYAEKLQQGHARFASGILAPAPELDLDECGLPLDLALDLFWPVVVGRIAGREGIVGAGPVVDSNGGIARKALEEVLQCKRVVVVRAPATARERMRSLTPVLVEGHAIRVNPLLARSMDTTFDGTTVCVFTPFGRLAQRELEECMRSSTHPRSSVTGAHLFAPGRDAALGAHLATRMPLIAQPRKFANIDEVHAAFDLGEVTWRTPALCRIRGRRHQTTVGRILLFETFPGCLPFERANRPLGAAGLRDLLDEVQLLAGSEEATAFAHRLCNWSLDAATRHGFSLGLGDLAPLPGRTAEIAAAQAAIVETVKSFVSGEITDGERYNRSIDAWATVEHNLRASLPSSIARDYPALTAALASSPELLKESLLRILGFGGLAKNMRGELVEVPVAHSLREGLSPIELFLAARDSRQQQLQGLASAQLADHLARLLTSVTRDIVVTEEDCGALDGLEFDLREHWPFDRLEGRVLASSTRDPLGREISPAGTVLGVEEIGRLLRAGIPKVQLRSPISCLAPRGVCAACLGHDPTRRKRPEVGTRVGHFAAAAIGKSAALLRERAFHIGSWAGVHGCASLMSRFGGTVQFVTLKLTAGNARRRALDDGGSITIHNSCTEPEWFRVPQGASVLVQDGDTVAPGTILAEFDPFFICQPAEVGGCVRYRGIVEGVTVQEVVNEVTGLANLLVIAAPGAHVEISLVDESNQVAVLDGERLAAWTVPEGTILMKREGDTVEPGDILTKCFRATSVAVPSFGARMGGIHQLAELLCLATPIGRTILSEIDGVVSRGEHGIAVTPTFKGTPRPDLGRVYPKRSGHCRVHDGELVRAGTPLFDGDPSPRDVLHILGPKPAAQMLLRDLGAMFGKDGIVVPIQHLELIVSEMLAWVRVLDPGDSAFHPGDIVHREAFAHANRCLRDRCAHGATADFAMLGIHEIPQHLSTLRALLLGHAPRRAARAALTGAVDRLMGSLERLAVGALPPSPSMRSVRRSST